MLLEFAVDCVDFLRGAMDVITMLSRAGQVSSMIVMNGQMLIVIGSEYREIVSVYQYEQQFEDSEGRNGNASVNLYDWVRRRRKKNLYKNCYNNCSGNGKRSVTNTGEWEEMTQ